MQFEYKNVIIVRDKYWETSNTLALDGDDSIEVLKISKKPITDIHSEGG